MYRRFARVEIDVDAVKHNVRYLDSLTPDRCQFMAVVKADGYGHGAEKMAWAVINAGADRLGVATVEEALELRGAGITAPIQMVAEPPQSSVGLLLEHDIVPMVATREFAVELGRAASQSGKRAKFHLMVDTGMNRIGVRAEEAAVFAASIADFPGLEHEGTATHFATSEVPGDWDFETQMKRFTKTLAEMRTEGVDPGIVHAANSGATILHPESHFDMVRCGIAVYGLHPGEATASADLRPAMSVYAQVSFVKKVAMGEGVSYGLTWRAASPTVVATLPVGYADGVHRTLSNNMEVLLGGSRCAQIGTVTMDQIMVEVPRGVEVSAGDEAVLVGTQGGECISMDEIASRAGTINYEMACAFGMRMERTYS